MKDFEIEIVSYLDKKGLVAEIYYESLQWAEMFQKGTNILLRLFPHPHKEYWEFSCEEALKIIEQAKTKLITKYNKKSFFEEFSILDQK